MKKKSAPGAPGAPARWADARKSGMGAAVGEASRVWFTAARGILGVERLFRDDAGGGDPPPHGRT